MTKKDIKKTCKQGLVAGVTTLRELYDSWSEDYLWGSGSCIDLTYEEYRAELEASGKTEEEINEELEMFEPDSVTLLFGDWCKNKDGKYQIDQKGTNGFAGTYSNHGGDYVVVEWSKWSVLCHHTSPCYRMRDGRPCGDLDTEGDSVEAYCLPEDHWAGEDE